MALYGHSRTMPLPDSFQWIGGSRKTGGVRIVHHQATTRLACHDGYITSCSSDDPSKLLGQFLLFHGALTEDLLRRGMAEQDETGKSLPDILVAMGAVTGDDLERLVEKKAREAIIGLFDWDDVEFRFDENEPAAANAMQVDLDVQDLLLQGMQRLDDKERIRAIFKEPSTVIAHTTREPPPELFSDWPVRKVYMAIDGERSLEEITLHVHGTGFLVAKIVLDLYNHGLIEVRGVKPPVKPVTRVETENPARQTERPIETSSRAADECAAAPEIEIVREGLLDKIPIPLKPREQLSAETLSAEEGFLINIADGTWDVRAMTWVAPMRPADVLSTLKGLRDRGLLELRDPE